MLLELSIKNFAIIESLSITLSRGLNILSGETGAGKSIILSAVSLILGDRAQQDLIRTGEDEAVVEALFSLPENNPIHDMIAERGIDATPEELTIKRIISREGKNRVFINGSLSTLSVLSEIGEELINISGQHEHQILLKPERHIDIVDSFGGLFPQRMELARMINQLQGLCDELSSIQMNEDDKAKREDFLRFQINEIDQAQLSPTEEEDCKAERELLANAEKLFKSADESGELLYFTEGSASEKIGSVLQMVTDISTIDPALAPLMESLKTALYAVEDAGKELKGYAGRVSFDPDRLNEIQERLRLIESLKKKYGSTVPDILAFSEKAKEELLGIERSEERISELKKKIETHRERTWEGARLLSGKRKETAKAFSKAIEDEVASLGMKGTTFSVETKYVKASPEDDLNLNGVLATPKGIDRIEFLISPNIGEEPRALARIASGGELSRILLAMKKTLAQVHIIPTLIFDEVDAGIGGGIAQVVGKKLKAVSTHQQVICITHLPQIAGFADTHYSVVKETKEARTITRVERLSLDERVMEIARMLGGETITSTTLKHAKEMIESSR
jgi:DNA repair protein RecN (Recombination protein N)